MTDNAKRSARLKFLLLAGLFAAPVLGAYITYFYFPEHMPSATTNYGSFFDPVETLPEDQQVLLADGSRSREPLLDQWTLVHWVAGDCGSDCEASLVLTRQTRLSLNDKRDRVRRLLLTNDPARIAELVERYSEAHHDLVVAGSDESLADRLHRGERGIVLLDPLGNVLMSYQPKTGEAGIQADFKGIRKDLKKLMKLSNIG